MTGINVPDMFRVWIRDMLNINTDIPDKDINLDRVHMTVENLEWTSHGNYSQREITRQANIIKREGIGNEAIGQVHSSSNSRDGIKVTIHQGIIKGLNRHLKLSLDGIGLEQLFGLNVNFDPSKRQSNIDNIVKLGLAMEQTLDAQGARAVISYKANECKVSFQCKVVLKGIVLAKTEEGSLVTKLHEMMKDLKNNYNGWFQSRRDDVAAIAVDNEMIKIDMIGELDLNWESDYCVTWLTGR